MAVQKLNEQMSTPGMPLHGRRKAKDAAKAHQRWVVLIQGNGEGNMGREAFPRKGQNYAESETNVYEGI